MLLGDAPLARCDRRRNSIDTISRFSPSAARAAKPVFADATAPAPLRAAAAKALLLADDDFFASGLKDACPMVRQTVIRAANNVSVKTLAQALKTASPADLARMRDVSFLEGKCGVCGYKQVCGGCRARAFGMTGNYMAEEPFCNYVPIRLQKKA